jgi:serine/threonine protein kinase/predicted Zn-dependent protease
MNEISATGDLSLEELVARLADEFAERLERGEQPAVEAYVARYPQHAGVIRNLLASLQFMSLSARGLSGRGAAGSGPLEPEAPLGDFRIVCEVGRGGMGVVYEAVQMSLGRRVALKVLPFAAALDARQLQRFKNEAQAAAHLHHQNIVPVHGVGCERGVHYYAMQFIDGQTLASLIHQLRREAGLCEGEESASCGVVPAVDPHATGSYVPALAAADTMRPAAAAVSTERSPRTAAFFRTAAQLGIQAAEALEHAHQLGVVHRDIKPANLLVDHRGNLWVTDFGLAHCQSQAGLTMSGDLVGTLRYMSPEQALAQRVGVDHRTDIYSLGVTLYELLTLEPAFGGRDRQELLRQIAFDEPRPPRRLNKTIPKELEIIVLKAMEKNPTDRYATAQEMADDLRRYLEVKPIRARRPGWIARLQKWSWRHRAVVSATIGSTMLVLTVASGFIAWQWRVAEKGRIRAEQAEKKAQAINDFLLKDLIGAADPHEAQGQKLTVEEVLDKAATRVQSAFPDQPELEASVRMTIGSTYLQLGLYKKAEPQLRRALELRQQHLGNEHPDTLQSVNELGAMLGGAGRWQEAEPLLREGLSAARPNLGVEHPTTLELLHNHAWVLANLGRVSEAAGLDRECLSIRRRVLGPENEETLATMRNLADHLAWDNKWVEAESVARESLRIASGAFPAKHPAILVAREGLVFVLFQEGKAREMESLARENLTVATLVWGPNHPRTWHCANGLALAQYQLGNLEKAEQLTRKGFEAMQRTYGPGGPWDGEYQFVLGLVFQAEGRWKEAETMLRESIRAASLSLGAENRSTLFFNYALGTVLQGAGKRVEAGKVFRDTLNAQRKVLPLGHIEIAESLCAWAEYLIEAGDNRQAEVALREGLQIERQPVPRVQKVVGQMQAAVGWVLTQDGRVAEAEALLREGLEICRQEFPAKHWGQWMAADAQSRLGGCLTALRRFPEAESHLLDAHRILERERAAPPARRAQATERVIRLYQKSGKKDKAEQWRAKHTAQARPLETGAEFPNKDK